MLLCFISVTFWQCQKEDDLQDGKHFGPNLKRSKVNVLTGQKALEIKSLLDFEYNKGRKVAKNPGYALREYNYTIDYSKIIEVIDTLGNTNYTFKIENHPDQEATNFFNLVLSVKTDGSTIKIVEYQMDEEFYNAYQNGEKDILDFEGTINFYTISTTDPCPPDDTPITTNPGTGGGGSGGGSSGPGSSGPGTTGGGGSSGGSGADQPQFATITYHCNNCHREYDNLNSFQNSDCWNSIYTYTVIIKLGRSPEPVQTNPSDPCPPADEEFGVLPEDPKTPCSQLKIMSSTSFYNQNITFLKGKAIGEKEHALVYKYFNNTSSFAPPTTAGHRTENPNTVDLSAFKDLEWIGAFHNHTMGNNPTIKMFGPDDIEWLFVKTKKRVKFYQQNNITPIDVSDLFLGLVNENETYCIKIKDWSQFLAFAPKYGEFKRKLEKAYNNSGPDASQIEYQKDLLKLLKEYEMGVGLFDQDQNGNWSEINLDPSDPNNTPIKTPCN